MSETEMRELDTWIDTNLFGWKPEHRSDKCDGVNIIRCGACGRNGHANCYGLWRGGEIQIKCVDKPCCETAQPKNYTAPGGPALEVLKKCSDKLGMDGIEICIGFIHYGINDRRFMVCTSNKRGFQTIESTLELAICFFAKKLFS